MFHSQPYAIDAPPRTSGYFHNTAVEIVNSKKQALKDGDEAVARQIGQGNDILGILSRGFAFLDYGWTSLLTIN